MKYFVIYEKVYGCYKGRCDIREIYKSSFLNYKVFKNKKERDEAQEIKESEFVGNGYLNFNMRLHVEKAEWKYKEISFEELSKNEYFKTFLKEPDAKEFCDNLNYLSVLFGPELKYLKNAPDSYINNPYFYKENGEVIKTVPTNAEEITKLFIEHKNKVAILKENIEENLFLKTAHDFYAQKYKEEERYFQTMKKIKKELAEENAREASCIVTV